MRLSSAAVGGSSATSARTSARSTASCARSPRPTARAPGPDQVEPFLGDAGGVPPWDLTDAIDAGRTETALELLTRMLGAGERHPLQVMAILQSHYAKLATLDGLDVRTEAEAAAAMGIKPGYPARKAMELSRRSGARRCGGRSTCWRRPTSTSAAGVTRRAAS